MRPTRGYRVLPPALLHRLIVLAGAAVAATSKRVGRVGRRQMSAASVTKRAAVLSEPAVSKIASVNPTPASPSSMACKCGRRSLSSGSITTLFGAFVASLYLPQRNNEA